MKTTIDFKVGPIRSVTLDPCPGHAMGPSVNVEVSTLIGKHHGLITPAQAQRLGLALVQAAQDAGGGVRCHDAEACQFGQRACPTPDACGVKP